MRLARLSVRLIRVLLVRQNAQKNQSRSERSLEQERRMCQFLRQWLFALRNACIHWLAYSHSWGIMAFSPLCLFAFGLIASCSWLIRPPR